ncbi:fimbrial protein [Xenorhabdus bovienii]|uniref:fimbrial protein n=1 Tax=Xenorhabdus bovienii TaxID=40576 RepID=UPI001EDEE9B6|nr:fimbrial protein [Xenorhabdus bovienii]MCG3463373.1 fimbrial protein [Xenorhabdus bovienii]
MLIFRQNYRFLLAIFILLVSLVTEAYGSEGSCRIKEGRKQHDLSAVFQPKVTISRSDIPGAVIYRHPVISNPQDILGIDCDKPEKISWKFIGYTPTSSRNDDTYDSGVPGIGIRMYGSNIELIKTNPKTGTGPIKNGVIQAYVGSTIVHTYHIHDALVTTESCILAKKNIIVPMGSIGMWELSGNPRTAREQNFSIDLDCDDNIPITLKFEGNTVSNDNRILALDQRGSHFTAGGIGLQILYQDQPVMINSVLKVGTSLMGIYSVPFKAHYIQTGSVITAGKANATAKVSIIYN